MSVVLYEGLLYILAFLGGIALTGLVILTLIYLIYIIIGLPIYIIKAFLGIKDKEKDDWRG